MNCGTVKILKNEICEGKEYSLIKLEIKGIEHFCIEIKGGENILESLGENFDEAKMIFELLLKNRISPEHLTEILSDIRGDIEKQFFI